MPQSPNASSEEAAFLLHHDTEFSEKYAEDSIPSSSSSSSSSSSLSPLGIRVLVRLARLGSSILTECRKYSMLDLIRCTLYAFVPTFFRKSTTSSVKTSTYGHLDGLRGVAALFVFFFHSSYTIWNVRPGYLSQPEYNSPLRLPFLRLLFAGDAMVSIFFVISGFVLSVKPVKLMRSGDREGLLNAVASAGFRRGIRLYTPCFVSTFIVMIVIRIGLFEVTRPFAENKDLLRGSGEFHMFQLESFAAQLWSWVSQSYNFVHVWDWNNIYAGNTGYDIHLWTIPDEYRCSMLLFLTQVIIARASQRIRVATLSFLIAFASSWGRWEMICFWSGAILAEIDIGFGPFLPRSTNLDTENNKVKSKVSKAHVVFWLLNFVLGLYFLSFPDQLPESTVGYQTLFRFVPTSFGQKNRFWQAIGAFLVTMSINKLSILQTVFTCGPIKYLGKISFALYLMHGLVIHTVGYTLLPIMWNITGRNSDFSIGLGWLMSQTLVTMVVIYCADIFWINVDTPSNHLCHWLETLYFQK